MSPQKPVLTPHLSLIETSCWSRTQPLYFLSLLSLYFIHVLVSSLSIISGSPSIFSVLSVDLLINLSTFCTNFQFSLYFLSLALRLPVADLSRCDTLLRAWPSLRPIYDGRLVGFSSPFFISSSSLSHGFSQGGCPLSGVAPRLLPPGGSRESGEGKLTSIFIGFFLSCYSSIPRFSNGGSLRSLLERLRSLRGSTTLIGSVFLSLSLSLSCVFNG